MRQMILAMILTAGLTAAIAQTRAGSSSSKTPAGATYILSDGQTVTKTSEALTTTTSDYNVVQVTKGTLNLNAWCEPRDGSLICH